MTTPETDPELTETNPFRAPTYTLDELADLLWGPRWGEWRLNDRALTLVLLSDHPAVIRYEFDLERCLDVDHIVDWFSHVSGKEWFDAAVFFGLFRAIRDILDPRSFTSGPRSFTSGPLRAGIELRCREAAERWPEWTTREARERWPEWDDRLTP